MTEVAVEALKPFHKTAQGDMVHPGDPPFMVGEVRAGELEANGLARRTGFVAAKAAPVPVNKMAPVPDDKVAPGPKPVAVRRRSPRHAATKLSGGQG